MTFGANTPPNSTTGVKNNHEKVGGVEDNHAASTKVPRSAGAVATTDESNFGENKSKRSFWKKTKKATKMASGLDVIPSMIRSSSQTYLLKNQLNIFKAAWAKSLSVTNYQDIPLEKLRITYKANHWRFALFLVVAGICLGAIIRGIEFFGTVIGWNNLLGGTFGLIISITNMILAINVNDGIRQYLKKTGKDLF